MPAALRSHSAVRCSVLPRLPAATLSSPLRFLASAISSASVLTPRSRLDRDHHRMIADIADRHEVAHHIDREVGLQLRQRDEIRGERHVERVAVARGVAATALMATAPAPPGWLMTSTCWPQSLVSPSARTRVQTSGLAPGPTGDTILTGPVGKPLRRAVHAVSASAAPPARNARRCVHAAITPATLLSFMISSAARPNRLYGLPINSITSKWL